MVNVVEKRPDVQIYYPVVLPTPLPAATHRVQRRPSRAVTIGVGVENRFHHPLQLHGRHRLGRSCQPQWAPRGFGPLCLLLSVSPRPSPAAGSNSPTTCDSTA